MSVEIRGIVDEEAGRGMLAKVKDATSVGFTMAAIHRAAVAYVIDALVKAEKMEHLTFAADAHLFCSDEPRTRSLTPVFENLDKFWKLGSILISNFSCTEEMLGHVITLMEKTWILHSLHLETPMMPWNRFASTLAHQKTLLHLGLNDAGVCDGAAQLLATALVSNNTLLSLSLSENQIGWEGGLALAAMLGKNRTLKSLFLSQNNVRDSAIDIANSVAANPVLEKLHMPNNNVEARTISRITQMLENHPSLQELNMTSYTRY